MNMMGTASASASGNSLGVDGIKEFKTVTSAMSAEYGGVEAAQIQMVSKNGTNQFHGDLFEYVRNSAMDARNHFDYTSQLGEERLPPFQRNQFGGLVSRVEDAPSFRRNTLGTVSFSNVQEFMTGIFSQESAGSGVFDRNYFWEEFALYAQDDWRATSRLVLNLGLRWEASTAAIEVNGRGFVLKNLATDPAPTPGTFKPQLHNFVPKDKLNHQFALTVLGQPVSPFSLSP